MAHRRVLAILPHLPATRRRDGKMVLTGRFVQGMEELRRRWDGEVITILEPLSEAELAKDRDRVLAADDVEVDPRELSFGIELMRHDAPGLGRLLGQCQIALAGVGHRQHHLAQLAKGLGVCFLHGTEYSLTTRVQIVRAEVQNPLLQARRIAWLVSQERLVRESIRLADGLQCAGTPTYDAYHPLNRNPFLYFESRVTEDEMITPELLEQRLAQLLAGGPLRLAFAGRLNRIKGADRLLRVARHLAELRVPFELHIYGGGLLEPELRRDIARLGLEGKVTLMGHLPLAPLMAHLQRSYDLFLCCHPQGDPSGAYLEMLASGLPIVGYANEALAGILARTRVGQAIPIQADQQLAKLIAELAGDRERIAEWARTARAFAKNHTFEKSFRRRVAHFRSVLEDAQTQPVVPTRRSLVHRLKHHVWHAGPQGM